MSDLNYNLTFREKDKGWQCIVSYKDKLGKWKQKSKQGFKTKKEAKAYSNVIIKELEGKQELNSDMEGITLKEFINVFLDHVSLYKTVSTITLYSYSFNKISSLNNVLLNKISTVDIQKCIDELIKDNYSYNTLKVVRRSLNVLFKSAMNQYNIINKNPVEKVVILKDNESKIKNALTKKELYDLINKTDDLEIKTCFIIAGMCGLRIGEILGLTWDDIDFKNCTIDINKQWKRLKTGWGLGNCKTANSYRKVPFNNYVKKALLEYKNNSVLRMDNRLFHWVRINTASLLFSTHIKKAGYDITIHELRHTYATILISNGVDFKTAAKLLGHDVEQTMKVYSHVTSDMLENAKNIIENIF